MKKRNQMSDTVSKFLAVWDRWAAAHPKWAANYDSYDLMTALATLRVALNETETTTCGDPDCGDPDHYIVTEADADCHDPSAT